MVYYRVIVGVVEVKESDEAATKTNDIYIDESAEVCGCGCYAAKSAAIRLAENLRRIAKALK